MKVRTRLVLLGAVVPVLALLVLAAVAGAVLQRRLAREIDEHLLAQAAVESIGLFDGEDGEPHLHAHRSPLQADLHGLIPVGAIYRASDGALLVHTHGAEAVPPTVRAHGATGQIELRTASASGAQSARRELVSAVLSPQGTRYTLYLAVSLERSSATMRAYWIAAAIAVAAVAALLAVVQFALAARLVRRVGNLVAYLPRLGDGQSEPPPARDDTGDELAVLRDGLYRAAQDLERSRAERERGLVAAAHDLRTPLGVMRTTIDLALRRPRASDELRAALLDVRAECDRLTALAGEVVAARRAAPTRAPVALHELARRVGAAMRPVADEAGQRLAVRAQDATVLGDERELRRALENLLHNALVHGPRGGAVALELTAGDATCRLRVTDDGPGISADRLEEVFLPFVRGPDSRGAGLGLAIVRQIATEHGGSAWAEPGPGGKVAIELPLAT